MMMWIFLSVLAICITVIAYKFIEEGCQIDFLCIKDDIKKINKSVAEIKALLEAGKGGAE